MTDPTLPAPTTKPPWLGLDPTMGSPLAAVADGRRGLSADLRAALEAHDA